MAKTRNNKLSIRVSPEEYKYFLALQRETGMTQADFLIMLLDNWKDKKDCEKINNKK